MSRERTPIVISTGLPSRLETFSAEGCRHQRSPLGCTRLSKPPRVSTRAISPILPMFRRLLENTSKWRDEPYLTSKVTTESFFISFLYDPLPCVIHAPFPVILSFSTVAPTPAYPRALFATIKAAHLLSISSCIVQNGTRSSDTGLVLSADEMMSVVCLGPLLEQLKLNDT